MPRTTLLCSLLCLAACATAQATAPAGAPAAAMAPGHHREVKGPLVKNGEARLGDATTCPVSGDTFVVAADSPSLVYEGKTYYFCCDDCVGDFRKAPRHYLGQTP